MAISKRKDTMPMFLFIILLSTHLVQHTVVQATPKESSDDETDTTILKTVLDTLRDVQRSLMILLSESNWQNQDLEMLKDDVGALKFGYAILQQTTDEQCTRSDKQHYTLRKQIEDFRNDTDLRLANLETSVVEIEECLGITKNATEETLALSLPGATSINAATSCREILEIAPQTPSGLYWIRGANHQVIQVFCDMEVLCPNETEPTGWMRVVSINMTDPTNTCPPGLNTLTTPRRVCAKNTNTGGCLSHSFPVKGVEYSQVCGRIIGYQDGLTDGFLNNPPDIESFYVDGISLTYGVSPRNHIWTFAVALDESGSLDPRRLCPCTNNLLSDMATGPPAFVEDDYFCDTGSETAQNIFFEDDPLWDGAGCGTNNECCVFNNPPWFRKEISPSTSEDIEIRLCDNLGGTNEDVNFEIAEIYIQ